MSIRYKLNRNGAWYSLLTEYELNEHELEIASNQYYGHVKIGDNIDVDSDGVISVKEATTFEKGVVQIVDDLITDDSTKVLSAKQGFEIKRLIDVIVNSGSENTVIVTDSLTSISVTEALSANKGRELKELVDLLELNKSTKSEFNALEQFVNDNIVKNGVPVTQSEKDEWNSKSSFDGDYNSLVNKPVIPTLNDTLVSMATNEGLTANQGRILDGKIKSESDRITTLENNQFSKDYNDLTNKPVIPSPTPLNNTLTSTSTTHGATANVAKTLNDKIISLQTRVDVLEFNSSGGGSSGLPTFVEDSLTSTSKVNALSANKGRELNEKHLVLEGKVQLLEEWTTFEF